MKSEAGTFDRLTADRRELFEPEIERERLQRSNDTQLPFTTCSPCTDQAVGDNADERNSKAGQPRKTVGPYALLAPAGVWAKTLARRSHYARVGCEDKDMHGRPTRDSDPMNAS